MLFRGPMTRAALVLSSLVFAACTVGQLPDNSGGTPVPDAGSGGKDGGPVGNGCADRAVAGGPHDHGGGVTHAGENCLLAGACHLNNNGAGPPFQFAGTVYKADGKTPNPGVNIRIKPASGAAGTTLVSDTEG